MNRIGVFGGLILTIFSVSGAEHVSVPPFAKGSRELALTVGAGPSTAILGSTIGHDITLAVVRCGLTLSDTLAPETYCEGHWELLGEFFAGAQYHPRVRYLAGVLPLFRYNFTRREPLVPFIDIGAGITLTDIYGPDLSGAFQFNEQIGLGAHYLFSNSTAVTIEYRFMHVSNGGIREPNYGLNANIFSLGITWFF